jgi:hypothetical protein
MPARSWSSLLIPNISFPAFRKAVLLAMVGALIAGCFGILHDQVTYTISPEYFTRMKFGQFRSADFGFSERIFVAEIGFLATWWVGLVVTWFLARIAIPKFLDSKSRPLAKSDCRSAKPQGAADSDPPTPMR